VNAVIHGTGRVARQSLLCLGERASGDPGCNRQTPCCDGGSTTTLLHPVQALRVSLQGAEIH